MTTKPAAHTPTPWSVATEQVPFLPKQNGGGMKVKIMGARQEAPTYDGSDPKAFTDLVNTASKVDRVCSMNVGLTPEMARANAAFIVRAVNAHEELVETIKHVRELLHDMDAVENETAIEYLDSAIAKAEAL